MTILYNVLNDNLTIQDMLETSSNPEWLKQTPFFAGGFKSLKDWFSKEPGGPVPKTIRACPGIADYLSKIIVVKFPVDILLNINEDGSYQWRTPMPLDNFNIASHQQWQYNNFTDKINIKIFLPLALSSNKNTEIMFTDPYYHTITPYSVVPGIVKLTSSNQSIQPINLLFAKSKSTYQFNAGQPLCYIFVCNEKIKLKLSTNKTQPFYSKRFLGDYRKK
jgi:hypothetical protein